MKLLGWMHRKFKQNSNEPFKDFGIGQPSLDEQQYYSKSNYGTKSLGKAHRDDYLRKSFASVETARGEDDDFEEESSAALSELFHGFLTIGTLGSDAAITDASTPTFAISVETITEKETEVTENELKLINDELERVLAADDGCNESSGRSSLVSTGRSSHGSTITLSGKPIEGVEANGNGTTVCPLQGYLFGSAVELPETTTVAKKEHRVSLGELFQRTKTAEEYFSEAKYTREEKQAEKEDKSAVYYMKKKLKRRLLNASRGSNVATAGNVDSGSTETKLHKILHMFHRKVHPANSTATQKSGKPHKEEIKNSISYETGYNNGYRISSDEDHIIYPRFFKSQSNPPQEKLSGSDSNGNRENWIKTDADYLVLEL
ncbi:protein LAZY 1-like isoform X2 [Cornus florida]|uniref:protein LAZY 1-like isoform X2 n=1 Tax=Cornus florida TaxID=4283 RepID=UPI00289F9411|nr:protein LAZY 1-like isoform X2 [Cornus florida]